MTSRIALLSIAAIALMLAAPAVAQQNTMPRNAQQQTMSNTGQRLSQQDIKFMKEAAAGGLVEVELGELARQKGSEDQVRQFGQRMERDHSNANQELMRIAHAKGIDLPQQLDPKHAQLRDKLARLQGAAFDREYMREMTRDHDADAKEFRRAAQTTQDADLKRFAQDTLNVVEQHDQLAHNIDRSLTATGSSRPPR